MATYNGEKYLKEQIDSILCQIESTDELVISDDGSTDNTVKIINSYNDDRIKLFSHLPSKSKYRFDKTTHNFENAINHSTGNIIILADQDDVWLPNKVVTIIDALSYNDIVCSDCKIVDSKLNLLYESKFKLQRPSHRIFSNFISASNIGCCMAFNRCVLDKVLPFPKYGVAQDLWIAVFGSMYYNFCYIQKPLILYRRHNGALSDTSVRKSGDSISYKISYRLRYLLSITRKGDVSHIIKNL